MRIISGKLKGKKILEPKDRATRPLKDLTKESIFNILQHTNKFNVEMQDSHVLDLFSGVGSFGLECLSRGAAYVTFVENYREVLIILKKNISNLNFENKSLIVEKDIFNDLNFNTFNKKFNIIFIDAPYKEKDLLPLIKKINDAGVLSKNGILIIHRHKKEVGKYSENFEVIEEKTYGISKIIFGNYS